MKYTRSPITEKGLEVRGGAIPLNQRIAFPSIEDANYLARTLRTLAVESNGLGHKVSNGGHIGQPLRKPARGIN